MANERVSQLTEIVASEISPNDLFLLTDTSAKESKKLQASQLVAYFESSASIDANHAKFSDTSSFISGSGVHGTVESSSYSFTSISSSFADHAVTADTSSFTLMVVTSSNADSADTASFLEYSSSRSNGTSSYSISSSHANGANQSLFLVYLGVNNGTSSYAISCSAAISSSYALFSSQAVSSSFATNADTASLALNAVTADNAVTASYIDSSSFLPVFITPQVIYNSTAAVGFATFNATSFIPDGKSIAIVDASVFNANTNANGFIYIRKNSSSPSYVLTAYKSGGGDDSVGNGGQGFYPLDLSGSLRRFQFSATQAADGGIIIRLVGYM